MGAEITGQRTIARPAEQVLDAVTARGARAIRAAWTPGPSRPGRLPPLRIRRGHSALRIDALCTPILHRALFVQSRPWLDRSC